MIKIQKINKLLTNKQIFFWVNCLNDKDINKFSDQKFKKHTFFFFQKSFPPTFLIWNFKGFLKRNDS